MASSSNRRSKQGERIEPYFDSPPEPKVSKKERVSAPRKSRARKKPRKKSKTVPRWRRILRYLMRPVPRLTYWATVLGLWGIITVTGIFAWYGAKMPSADNWAIPDRPPNVRIEAADGSLIANRGLTGGKALSLSDMSVYIPQAVIAIEDRRFYSHFGFDPIGFTRAMSRNIWQGRMREGGSTITQQLAKNLFLTSERTFGRKVQELILAVWLETRFSKSEILELYLNRVYFGAGATGVDAASRRYFGKSPKHVNLGEAAMLAGLLKAPSRYSPQSNPKLANQRAEIVLAAMQREGYVKEGAIDLKTAQPGLHARHFRSGPEHFIADMVMKRAKSHLEKIDQDVVIKTTISPYLMTVAHSLLDSELKTNGHRNRVSQGALVTLARDGAIQALIGGRDYAKSQFNRAVNARRQPGSAFKPFVWLKALENGLSPDTILMDTPRRYGKWQPKNYDKKYRGAVRLDDAFAASLNTIAAQLVIEAGPKPVAGAARRMGIKSPLKTNASLALGTSEVSLLELTSSYVPFANGGYRARPHLITKIHTASGRRLFSRKSRTRVRVVEPRELSMMNDMLQRVVSQGTGRHAALASSRAAGKTGTSQNFRDAWFIGHADGLTTGIWFGNDDNSSTRKLTGGNLPARIWKSYMETALISAPAGARPLPAVSIPQTVPTPTWRPNNQIAVFKPRQRISQKPKKAREPASNNSLKDRINSHLNSRNRLSISDLLSNR